MTARPDPLSNQTSLSHDFCDRVTSLFLRFEAGHMGGDMYSDHSGVRSNSTENAMSQKESMSGVLKWNMHAKNGTIPSYGHKAFSIRLLDVARTVGHGLPIVEYGPGSMEEARCLIDATNSKLYIPVDISEGIISQASLLGRSMNHCVVSPVIMDLFSQHNKPVIEQPALAAFLGSTVSNIPGPVPAAAPRDDLVNVLRSITRPIGVSGGYILVTTHSEQSGLKNINLYNEKWHRDFGVNFLYRMQVELPVENFDPGGFDYVPVWHEHCALIAHTVRANRDQIFTIRGNRDVAVIVKAGEVFHYNNSFKYHPTIFEECVTVAGLSVVKKWNNEGNMDLYLLQVPPRMYHRIEPQTELFRMPSP